jgi:hypothetical protein
MIQRTTKGQVSQQIRRVKEAARVALKKGHYAKYRYARNWLKAHAALLKETAQ